MCARTTRYDGPASAARGVGLLARIDLVNELLGARQRNDAALEDRLFLHKGLALVDFFFGDLENARLEALHLRLEFATLEARDIPREVLDGAVSVRIVQLR